MQGQPGAVLFACNFNRVRSPMAEGLMKLRFGTQIYVDSCGVAPEPELDPFVTVVMDEIGADLSHHHPKKFADLVDGSFDVVVSFTPQAQHHAVEMSRGRAVDIDYWPVSDPTLTEGSREEVLDAYRRTRDEIAARIEARFGRSSTPSG